MAFRSRGLYEILNFVFVTCMSLPMLIENLQLGDLGADVNERLPNVRARVIRIGQDWASVPKSLQSA